MRWRAVVNFGNFAAPAPLTGHAATFAHTRISSATATGVASAQTRGYANVRRCEHGRHSLRLNRDECGCSPAALRLTLHECLRGFACTCRSTLFVAFLRTADLREIDRAKDWKLVNF